MATVAGFLQSRGGPGWPRKVLVSIRERWSKQKMAADRNRDESDAAKGRGLAIYGYPQCPFCRRVLNAIDSLGLDIPLRNTLEDSDRRDELLSAMGRATVPVLSIEGDDGQIRWVPESADIVRYLKEHFG
jgi:glutaredoxin